MSNSEKILFAIAAVCIGLPLLVLIGGLFVMMFKNIGWTGVPVIILSIGATALIMSGRY